MFLPGLFVVIGRCISPERGRERNHETGAVNVDQRIVISDDNSLIAKIVYAQFKWAKRQFIVFIETVTQLSKRYI
jgi:hypothetical protein